MAKQKTDRYTRDMFEVSTERKGNRVVPSVAQRAAAFRARSKFNMLKRMPPNGR